MDMFVSTLIDDMSEASANARVQAQRRVSADVAWNPLLGPLEFKCCDCFFPVLSIERSNFNVGFFCFKIVEAPDVDTVHVRRRTRIAEWVNAAVFTEPVFGRF